VDGNGSSRARSSMKRSSAYASSVSPARESAWMFSGRSLRSERFVRMRGMMEEWEWEWEWEWVDLWNSVRNQAYPIELAMESRSI
jgi:hypothetical protein